MAKNPGHCLQFALHHDCIKVGHPVFNIPFLLEFGSDCTGSVYFRTSQLWSMTLTLDEPMRVCFH